MDKYFLQQYVKKITLIYKHNFRSKCIAKLFEKHTLILFGFNKKLQNRMKRITK